MLGGSKARARRCIFGILTSIIAKINETDTFEAAEGAAEVEFEEASDNSDSDDDEDADIDGTVFTFGNPLVLSTHHYTLDL